MSGTVSELRECPFCGSETAGTSMVRDGRRVVCGQCGASSGSKFHGPLSMPSADERAIAAWNTRTLTAARERIEALEGAQVANPAKAIAELAQRILELAPLAGLHVGITIKDAPIGEVKP